MVEAVHGGGCAWWKMIGCMYCTSEIMWYNYIMYTVHGGGCAWWRLCMVEAVHGGG